MKESRFVKLMEANNAALVAVGKAEHRGSKKTGGYYAVK